MIVDEGEMSPAKTGSLFSPLFRFPVAVEKDCNSLRRNQDVTLDDKAEQSAKSEEDMVTVECDMGDTTNADNNDDDDEVFITSSMPPSQKVGSCVILLYA